MISASMPIMAKGSAGKRVAELQVRLAKIFGENSNVQVTGVYDRQTQNAVMSMQLSQNAWAQGIGEPTVRNDGLVDAETWEFLASRTGRVSVPRVGLGAAPQDLPNFGSGDMAILADARRISEARIAAQRAMLSSQESAAFGHKALVLGAVAVAVLVFYWVK